jgi:hypothetical protein
MGDEKPDHNGLLNYIAGTVENLRDQLATMRDQMVTKDDLAQMATKDDLAQMATKEDLRQVELRLSAKIETEIAAVRGDVEQVQLRLTSIEKALNTRLNQIETELSRLRSVVYLLVKDKPELLRLLGQEPPPS